MKQKHFLFTCVLMLMIGSLPVKAAEPIVCAYDLRLVHHALANTYTFSFTTNTAVTSAEIVFFQGEAEVRAVSVSDVSAQGSYEHTMSAEDLPGAIGDIFTWGVRLQGEAITGWALVKSDNTPDYGRALVAVDKSPESDYFGRIYVGERKGGNSESSHSNANGIYIYGPTLTLLRSERYMGGQTYWASQITPAVGADGTVYFGDYGDDHSGLYVADPAQIDGTYTQFFDGTRDDKGAFKNNNDVLIGGSAPGVSVYHGEGTDVRLLVTNEDDGKGGISNPKINRYDIGQMDGTLKKTWSEAPTHSYTIEQNGNGNHSIQADEHGFWVGQRGNNGEANATLQFYDWEGAQQFTSFDGTTFDGIVTGDAFAVRGNTLVLNNTNANSQKEFIVYEITWEGNKPTLTRQNTYTHTVSDVRRMTFDYAGNLLVSGGDGVQVYVLPCANITTVPAKHTLTVTKAEGTDLPKVESDRNIYAYNLDVAIEEDNYIFTFNANDNAVLTTLVFYDASGEEVGRLPQEHATQGENSYTISASELPGDYGEALTWAVELTTNEVTTWKKLHSTTSISGNMHNVIDNSPESDRFGQIYVANNTSSDGIYLCDAMYNFNTTKYTYTGITSPKRMSVDITGKVYIAEYCDADASGAYIGYYDDIVKGESKHFFTPTTHAGSGVLKNGDTYVACSFSSVYIYGTGADTKLLAYAEDAGGSTWTEYSILIYNIGNPDGTVKESWSEAPSKVIKSAGANADGTIVGTKHGIWLAQRREDGANLGSDSGASIQFFTWDGDRKFDTGTGDFQYNSGALAEISGTVRAGMALSPHEDMLVVANGTTEFKIYDIEWDAAGTPTVTYRDKYTHGLSSDIYSMNFDYAGNLLVSGACGFHVYAVPHADNTTLVPAKKAKTVVKGFTPVTVESNNLAIYAYDLRVAEDTENNLYTFSFNANNQASSVALEFYDGDVLVDRLFMNLHSKAATKVNDYKYSYSYTLPADALPGEYGTALNWGVRLSSAPVEAFGEANIGASSLQRLHVAIDNSPESPYFGRIYGENKGTSTCHLYGWGADYQSLGKALSLTSWTSVGRPSVDPMGKVWLANYGDNPSGMYILTPTEDAPTQWTYVNFFEGGSMPDGKNVWQNSSGVDMGSSTPGCSVYGTGEDMKLFVANEDAGKNTNTLLYKNGYNVYNIGAQTNPYNWATKPSLGVDVNHFNGDRSITATKHGVWLCINRTNDGGPSSTYPSVSFYDHAGDLQFVSDGTTDSHSTAGTKDNIEKSQGGGLAIWSDADGIERKLAILGNDYKLQIYDIEWTGNVPTLTLRAQYEVSYTNVGTLHFDYAGNLIGSAGTDYELMKLVVFALPKADNTCTTPAQKSQVVIRKHADYDNVFIGKMSNRWDVAGNWSLGHVPTASESALVERYCMVDVNTAVAAKVGITANATLVISATGALTITDKIYPASETTPLTTDNILIEANANGQGALAMHGYTEGAIPATVQLYAHYHADSDELWQAVGMPFENVLGKDYFIGSWLCKLNSTTKEFDFVKTGYQTAFTGYLITQNEAQKRYLLQGTLVHAGTREIPLTYSEKATATTGEFGGDNKGVNFIANSWMAPILVANLLDDIDGAESTVHLVEAGNYAAKNNATEGAVIAPLQGFFITTTNANGGTLSLDYNNLISKSEQPTAVNRAPATRPIEMERLQISVNTINSKHDKLLLVQNENFSTDFDNGYDATKLINTNGYPNIFVEHNERKHAIVATPDWDSTWISFRQGDQTEYTLSFEYEGEEMYLEDTYTHQTVEVFTGSTFTFMATSDDTNRFLLRKPNQGNITTSLQNVWVANGQLHLNNPTGELTTVAIYSTDGKLLKKFSTRETITQMDMSVRGMYIIQLTTPTATQTIKQIF